MALNGCNGHFCHLRVKPTMDLIYRNKNIHTIPNGFSNLSPSSVTRHYWIQ